MKWTIAIAAVLALAAGAWIAVTRWRADDDLLARLAQRVPFPATGLEPCPAASPKRLVILVLGQSNAGNHEAEEQLAPPASSPSVMVSNGLVCALSSDPLPGATGRHRSLWTGVASKLRARGYGREVVFVPLAVDATAIADWTRPSSRLRAALERLLADSAEANIRPDLVIWQQGEADARSGTTTDEYARRLQILASIVRGAGVSAPMLVALSTRCGSGPSAPIRSAIAQVASTHTDISVGPDTDAIGASMRNHDCHFSARGLDAAADLWARALVAHAP